MAPILIVGFGVTGEAVARRLVAEGEKVVAIEDHPTAVQRKRAEQLGVDLVESPGHGLTRDAESDDQDRRHQLPRPRERKSA
jgi:Trk K+ transport system NAD-binding subunit